MRHFQELDKDIESRILNRANKKIKDEINHKKDRSLWWYDGWYEGNHSHRSWKRHRKTQYKTN